MSRPSFHVYITFFLWLRPEGFDFLSVRAPESWLYVINSTFNFSFFFHFFNTKKHVKIYICEECDGRNICHREENSAANVKFHLIFPAHFPVFSVVIGDFFSVNICVKHLHQFKNENGVTHHEQAFGIPHTIVFCGISDVRFHSEEIQIDPALE